MLCNLLLILFCLSSVKSVFDRPKGSPCEWEGARGKCVNARLCESFYYERKKGNYPPICSFDGEEAIVCCVDCASSHGITRDFSNKDRFKTGRKYEEQCLLYQHLLPYECSYEYDFGFRKSFNEKQKCYEYSPNSGGASYGGKDTNRGDFPHMALLGYGEALETAQWLCGGSLISERHILTAAHCGAHSLLGPVTYVALGLLRRSDPPRYWKRYKVKLFYPHHAYKAPHKYHDIAIIETATTVNLTDGVRPACLSHKQKFIDDVAYATGWGSLGPHMKNADVMQKVTLKEFPAEECAQQYPPHRHLLHGYNHSTQMCYGDREVPRDTCEGDSGGPLQKRDYEASYCLYAIIGVTSSGHACGPAVGQAGLYTRVSYYVPWIESVVWP